MQTEERGGREEEGERGGWYSGAAASGHAGFVPCNARDWEGIGMCFFIVSTRDGRNTHLQTEEREGREGERVLYKWCASTRHREGVWPLISRCVASYAACSTSYMCVQLLHAARLVVPHTTWTTVCTTSYTTRLIPPLAAQRAAARG